MKPSWGVREQSIDRREGRRGGEGVRGAAAGEGMRSGEVLADGRGGYRLSVDRHLGEKRRRASGPDTSEDLKGGERRALDSVVGDQLNANVLARTGLVALPASANQR